LTSLDAGAHYEFRVQAICSADSSGFSVTEEFYTLIPVPDHVVICIMENKDFYQIVNSPSAVYINSIINNYQSALFENSFAIETPKLPKLPRSFFRVRPGDSPGYLPGSDFLQWKTLVTS
jgi:hypothetical protein